MIKRTIFLLLCLSIIGCQNTSDYKVLDIKLDEKYKYCTVNKGFSTTSQIHIEEDVIYLMENRLPNSEILKICISERKITEKISLKSVLKPNEIFSFYYHNDDSIIILRDIVHVEDISHDSILIMTDINGNIHTVFDLTDGQFPTSKNPEVKSESALLSTEMDNLVVYENRLFLSAVAPFSDNKTLKEDEESGILFLYYIDFTKENRVHAFNSHNPIAIDTTYLNKSRRYEILPLSKDEVVIGESQTPVLWKINISDDRLEKVSKGYPKLISYSDSAKDKPEFGGRYPFLPNYYKIYPVKSGGMFLRTAFINAPLNYTPNNASDFAFKNIWLGLYDSQLNLLAEGVSSKYIFSNNGLVINGELYFDVFDEGKCNFIKSFDYEITNLESKDVADYLKQNITPKKYSKPLTQILRETSIPEYSVVMMMHTGCPQCINSVSQYYLDNVDYFKENNVYLYVKESENAKQLLGKSNVSENLFYEINNEMEPYISNQDQAVTINIWNGSKFVYSTYLTIDLLDIIDEILQKVVDERVDEFRK